MGTLETQRIVKDTDDFHALSDAVAKGSYARAASVFLSSLRPSAASRANRFGSRPTNSLYLLHSRAHSTKSRAIEIASDSLTNSARIVFFAPQL